MRFDEDDGDEEEEDEVEYIGEGEEHREIFSSLSCKTSQNNSYGEAAAAALIYSVRARRFPVVYSGYILTLLLCVE